MPVHGFITDKIIGFAKDRILPGGDRRLCAGIEVCVENNLNETCESAQAIVNGTSAQVVNEGIVTFQRFVTAEWNRKPDNAQKRGLPRKVRSENLAACAMYLIGGENDCRIGGKEKEWERAWSSFKAKALATRGSNFRNPNDNQGRFGVGNAFGNIIAESIRQAREGRQQIGGRIVGTIPSPLPGGSRNPGINQARVGGIGGLDSNMVALLAGGVGLFFLLRK